MLVKTKKGITICTLFDNETITLDDSLEWSIWLKNVRDLSTSTINSFMKSMERFWIWSLYNPVVFYVFYIKEVSLETYEMLNKNFIQDEMKDNKIAGCEAYHILNRMKDHDKKEEKDKQYKLKQAEIERKKQEEAEIKLRIELEKERLKPNI